MQGIHIKNASGKTGSLVNGDLNLEDTVVDISKIVTTDVSEAALGKMGKTFVANATFTGIDNKIVMTGIVTALGLEVGDVIVFSNAITQNNKPRTVESITDADTIIVNYEHCGSRGNGSLKLTDETKSGASVKLLAKWFNAPIGLGQEWVALTGFRVGNTNYVNTTNRTITVFAKLGTANYQSASIIVDGVEASFSSVTASTGSAGATAPVNAGGSYKSFATVGVGVQTVREWSELR